MRKRGIKIIYDEKPIMRTEYKLHEELTRNHYKNRHCLTYHFIIF